MMPNVSLNSFLFCFSMFEEQMINFEFFWYYSRQRAVILKFAKRIEDCKPGVKN